MESIMKFMKKEDDIFYKIGKEEGKEEFVKYLLENTEFTISKIANLANVTEAFVRKIKKSF